MGPITGSVEKTQPTPVTENPVSRHCLIVYSTILDLIDQQLLVASLSVTRFNV